MLQDLLDITCQVRTHTHLLTQIPTVLVCVNCEFIASCVFNCPVFPYQTPVV